VSALVSAEATAKRIAERIAERILKSWGLWGEVSEESIAANASEYLIAQTRVEQLTAILKPLIEDQLQLDALLERTRR
jgi:hypothetical protein